MHFGGTTTRGCGKTLVEIEWRRNLLILGGQRTVRSGIPCYFAASGSQTRGKVLVTLILPES